VRSGQGRSSGSERGKKGNERKREDGVWVWGEGAGPRGCRANPAGLRSEARFQLLSSAWLRGVFRVRWALPRSYEPTYQTAKIVKRWDEVRYSVLAQATKHTLKFLFFEIKDVYIKLASRLIKNLPVPLGTLVRKRVRLKLAASVKVQLHRL
jgi:hypothetical protein